MLRAAILIFYAFRPVAIRETVLVLDGRIYACEYADVATYGPRVCIYTRIIYVLVVVRDTRCARADRVDGEKPIYTRSFKIMFNKTRSVRVRIQAVYAS